MAGTADRGLETMRAYTSELPSHLRTGFAAGLEVAGEIPASARSVLAVGLGGSAIAPDFVSHLAEVDADFLLQVVRGPTLPRAGGAHTPIVLVSYSGATAETLAAFDAARRRKARIVVVSSGGELTERAVEAGVPLVPVRAGYPPRSALGLLLGALLGVLDPLFPESNELRVSAASDKAADSVAEFASADGGPAQLAARIGRRSPTVYAHGPLRVVARRWATQIEENAKRLAQFDELPEACHNALVGWDALRRSEAARRAVVLLETEEIHPLVAQGASFLGDRLSARGVRFMRQSFAGTDLLDVMVRAALFGDFLSLGLAARSRVDPLLTPVLTDVRRSLRPVRSPAPLPQGPIVRKGRRPRP
ncbi:MAG TPA: SIS domain-containing protein [Thermoplasmata archaeon]|nr:SIS domain-containing protein [Thermoplasmata archaeon]